MLGEYHWKWALQTVYISSPIIDWFQYDYFRISSDHCCKIVQVSYTTSLSKPKVIIHYFQFICSIIRYCCEWSWYHYKQLFLLAWVVLLPSLISSDLAQYWPDILFEMDEHCIFLSTSKGIVQHKFMWSYRSLQVTFLQR